MPKEFLDLQGLQTLVSELETNIVAEEYSSSATYAIGDYCIYNNLFYRCTTATTGTWDSTAWVKVFISDELSQSSGASSVAQLEDVQLSNLSDNDLLVYDSNLTGGKLWKNANKNFIVDLIYPVGSIYLSVTDSTVAMVEARFGGTWVEFGSGKTLVGVDGNDTDFDTAEEIGGTKSVTLTSSQSGVPAHSHSVTTVANTSGTPSTNTSGTPSNNTSGTPSNNTSGTPSNNTSAGPSTANTSEHAGHTHTVTSAAQNLNLRINNAWMTWVDGLLAAGSAKSGYDGGTARPGYVTLPALSAASGGKHSHTLSSHTHGLQSHTHSLQSHTHSLQNHTHNLGNHTHSVPALSGTASNNTATDASQAHTNLQPYITVYMYKRTA